MVPERGKDGRQRPNGPKPEEDELLKQGQQEQERLFLQAETQRHAREFAALDKAARAMVSTLDLDAVLHLVTAEITSLLEVEWASVLLHEPATDELVIAAAVGPAGRGLVGARLPATAGIAGWVLQHREAALVTDVHGDPRFYNRIDQITGLTTRSIAAVPLVFKDKVLGVVEAINKTNGPLSQGDVEILRALASSAAIAIDNARLYEVVARGKREWETTFDAIADGIAILDADFGIVRANRALAERLDMPVEALIGHHCYELVHRTTRPPEWCPCVRAYASGNYEEAEVEEANLGGFFRLEVYPLLEAGQVRAGVLVLRDITTHKQMEAELIQAERLAAIGQVTATIVHEIRNVLSGISSGLQYMQEMFAEGDERREASVLLEKEVERAFQILEDVRLATRPLKLECQPCSLAVLVEKVLNRFAAQFAAGRIVLQRSYAEDLPLLSLDSLRIEQALANLVRNAWEASSQGSSLEVAMYVQPAGEVPDQVVLTITDHGPGIPDDVLGQVFEPFFTTKPSGLGLGLAVANRLIQAHGGSIELDSVLGQGTRVLVRLPIAFGPAG